MAAWDGGQEVSAQGRAYQKLAANGAAVALGANGGGIGDSIDYLWLLPTTTGPGTVVLLDGVIAVWTWPAGLTLTDTRPIYIPLNIRAVSGPLHVTTGANIAALATGQFS